MKQKPRMPKKFRRQIEKDKKKSQLKEVDKFFEAMKSKLKEGRKITEEDGNELNKIVGDDIQGSV